MNDWTERGPEPVRPSTAPTFEPGQRVIVTTATGVEYTGELRAVDDGLAVVMIDGRFERVPVELVKPA